jgi:phosphoribosylanthranilate isomerase
MILFIAFFSMSASADNIYFIVTASLRADNIGVLKKTQYIQYYSSTMKMKRTEYSEEAVAKAYEENIKKKHKRCKISSIQVHDFLSSKEVNEFARTSSRTSTRSIRSKKSKKSKKKRPEIKQEKLTLLVSKIEKANKGVEVRYARKLWIGKILSAS